MEAFFVASQLQIPLVSKKREQEIEGDHSGVALEVGQPKLHLSSRRGHGVLWGAVQGFAPVPLQLPVLSSRLNVFNVL